MDELLKIADEVEEKYHDMLKEGDKNPITVFLKDHIGPKGELWPLISSHMLLGNFKANCRVMVNNGDKSILSSKVSVGEVFSLDVAPIEEFMISSNDIVRKKEGNNERFICERIIRFQDKFGNTVSTIGRSEILRPGTEFSCHLRVRAKSPINKNSLTKLLHMGKSQGLGPWRGSGGRGQYEFKLKILPDYKEVVTPGWN
jgi:hypothetical protein